MLLPDDHLDALTAAGWDLRASVEGQVRSLTAMQRCIESYRTDRGRDALAEIAKHLADVEGRCDAVRDALRFANDSVALLQQQP